MPQNDAMSSVPLIEVNRQHSVLHKKSRSISKTSKSKKEFDECTDDDHDHTVEPEKFVAEKQKQIEEVERVHQYKLLDYSELPPFLQDNQWISSGYRSNFTLSLAAKSIFRYHNESLCIWTHLGGTILFFFLCIYTQTHLLENPTGADRLVFLIFLICAQCQMACSTIFHTFGCCSPKCYTRLAKLDYSGISIMIVGSYYPPLYYTFACHPTWRTVYMTCISLFGIIGLGVSSIPIFSTPPYRLTRAAFFLAFGLFAVFPVPHFVWLNGWGWTWPILWRMIVMGFFYVGGAVIYSSRVPERIWPGRFDYGFASHVIWHLFTIAAPLFQLSACLVALKQRAENPC